MLVEHLDEGTRLSFGRRRFDVAHGRHEIDHLGRADLVSGDPDSFEGERHQDPPTRRFPLTFACLTAEERGAEVEPVAP